MIDDRTGQTDTVRRIVSSSVGERTVEAIFYLRRQDAFDSTEWQLLDSVGDLPDRTWGGQRETVVVFTPKRIYYRRGNGADDMTEVPRSPEAFRELKDIAR